MSLRKRRRGLLAGAVVTAVLAVVAAVGAAHERALLQRGVTTTTTVVHAPYDPGGGDPGGWTTDTVRFEAAGHVQHVEVGHHGDARPERAAGTLRVVFDPQQPAVAMSAAELDGATPGLDFALAAGLAALLILIAGGLLLLALPPVKSPAVTPQAQRARP